MLALYLHSLTHLAVLNDRLFRIGGAAILAGGIVILGMPAFTRRLERSGARSDFDRDGRTSPPIMGGALIVVAVLVATVCFAQLNSYAVSALVVLVLFGGIGGVDDLMKVRSRKRIAAGEEQRPAGASKADGAPSGSRLLGYFAFALLVAAGAYAFIPELSGYLTVPFVKPSTWHPYLPRLLFIPFMSLVIVSVANGANFTDGIDSLASVPIITNAAFLAVVAYIGGNAVFAEYLFVPLLPGADELAPIAAAVAGGTLGYLWYNSPPASVFMGDTGAIGLGGLLGVMYVMLRVELFVLLVGVVFVVEAVSVLSQTLYFKLTRRFSASGEGRRIFLCAPYHHHLQRKWASSFEHPFHVNSKIAWRFHIVSIMALVVGLWVYVKVR